LTGRPCATGGAVCAYVEHEPQTDIGWQVWDLLLRCHGQLRFAGNRVVGLDMAGALALGDGLGYDRRAMAELLPAAEAGLIAGLDGALEQMDGSDHG
jgi:hypothetical protein